MIALRKFLLFAASLLASVYTAFVAMSLWNWFAVDALHAPALSFLQAVGLIWLAGLIRGEDSMIDPRWQRLFKILDVLTPAEKRTELADALKEWEKESWLDAGAIIYQRIIGSSLILLLGYGLHVLTSG